MSRAIRNGLIPLALAALVPCAMASAEQPFFATPEAALEAFAEAVSADDGQPLVALLGPEHEDDLIGGDPASARQNLAEARTLGSEGLSLVPGDDDTTLVVLMGRNAWPMPIPLVQTAEGWRFDTAAGLEEMIDRRIGANELAAIGYARTYVEAQVEYASADRDGDEVLEYAQKLVSTPGERDGLYWDDPTGEAPSPLGPLAASEEDYTAYREAEESFHGYYYRVLTGQGPNPPGGAYDYVINGNMIAGFALVAWPADYGNSGIMTFVVSHQGKLYQKDLGEQSAQLADSMSVYDPDDSWEEVAENEGS